MDRTKPILQDHRDRPMTDSIIVNAVWEKAVSELGFVFFRRDHLGNVIARHHFNCQTEYGWTIEHIVAPEQGGDDSLINLRPVHWRSADRQRAGGTADRTM